MKSSATVAAAVGMAAAVTALAAFGIGGPAQAAETEPASPKSAAKVVPSGPSVAAAQDSAWNLRTLMLKFPAPKGSVSCVRQTIYLAADWYLWETVVSGINVSKQIYLAAGSYGWVDCIRYFERASGFAVYQHQSALQKLSTGGYARLPVTFIQNSVQPGYVQKWYGSKLTPL
jgi:hypothetical protein